MDTVSVLLVEEHIHSERSWTSFVRDILERIYRSSLKMRDGLTILGLCKL